METLIILISLDSVKAGHFAMSHGSHDLNLGSDILILCGDIRLRTRPNIGGTYGSEKFLMKFSKNLLFYTKFSSFYQNTKIYYTS